MNEDICVDESLLNQMIEKAMNGNAILATGFKDRMNNDIFFGDRLKLITELDGDIVEEFAIVKWEKGCICLDIEGCPESDELLLLYTFLEDAEKVIDEK